MSEQVSNTENTSKEKTSNGMKVLIATGLYPPEIGGPATYTVLLEKELPIRGHEVIVVPFSLSRKYPRILRHFHYCLLVMLKSREVKVIFAQDVFSVGFPALVAARLLGKRFFVRVPGDYAWEQASQRYGVEETIDEFQTKHYSLKIELLRFFQRLVVRSADVVITPSEYFKVLVTGWGVDSKKIHTIYNGVDLLIDTVSVTKPASLTMVSAGRLVPWKGFATLISVMRDLPSWNLVILGDGPDKERLLIQAQEMGVANRVHLLGSVTRSEVADAFVLNTEFESFSYQIVEAMAAGVPVITTNVGSLPELLTNGREGLLLRPSDEQGICDAVRSVITEKTLWKQRTQAAQRKAEQFSIRNTVDALCLLLEKK